MAKYHHDFDEGPGEHDAHLLDEREPVLAECAECGKALNASATRCHHCGAQFHGQAWQATLDGRRPWSMHLVVGLLVLMLIIAFTGIPGQIVSWFVNLF